MSLRKLVVLFCSTFLIAGCSTLKQWEDDLFYSSESTNRHSSAKVSSKKAVRNEQRPSFNQTANNVPRPASQTVVNKRINTTACKDSDDWYLDGYRVGKSFRAQKNQMLQQRSQYCGYNVNSLPSQYHSNWERGFKVGSKS